MNDNERIQHLISYLGALAELQRSNFLAHSEITAVIKELNAELAIKQGEM